MKKARPSATWNRKVAQNRGERWRKNMQLGKLNALMKPTELRRARVTTGNSQETVAKSVGVSTASYAEIEKGIRPVKKERALKIASKFNGEFSDYFETFNKNKFVAKEIAIENY